MKHATVDATYVKVEGSMPYMRMVSPFEGKIIPWYRAFAADGAVGWVAVGHEESIRLEKEWQEHLASKEHATEGNAE